MSYANFMVNLELGLDNHNLMNIAGQLAEVFEANIIGIVGCCPMIMPYGDGYINGDLMKEELDQSQAEIVALEAEFRKSLRARANHLEWRSSTICSSIADFVATEASSADVLIVTASEHIESGTTRHMNNGDVLLQLGRPMLLVPKDYRQLHLQTIMIAWKDTMESRRAVYDSLPLLRYASKVFLMEITSKEEQALVQARHQLVIEWLAIHQIKATSLVIVGDGDEAEKLKSTALEMNVDLLVAGAYGHSRLREWVIGGMTREIMCSQIYCSLISH
ncbi:universal stress protein [Undibacterium sp. SXout20W]|uniref:universal stress protein n=1 Tax=Undibacterium sp. SXout20W TaxID=3413051 RepID=UPI003BF2FE8C